MNILGIETSCDETSASVVRDGREVLSSIVYSQIAAHSPYGGVVPEIASRQHVEHLPGVLVEAVRGAGLEWAQLDALAVTYGPGLASSLLVGLAGAKGLALRLGLPLTGIHHMEAHLYSAFLGPQAPAWETVIPCLALIVSGGHTLLLRVEAPGRYRLLGHTVDDAAGEAFDKGATLLGLGYPGGPAIDRAARAGGRPDAVIFPRGFPRKLHARFTDDIDPGACFSFSGIKTALLYHLRKYPPDRDGNPGVADLAASYQEAIVDTLVTRTLAALDRRQTLIVAGGVSLNRRLRELLTAAAAARGFRLLLAEPAYCTDNAAMVAGLAAHKPPPSLSESLALDACPSIEFG